MLRLHPPLLTSLDGWIARRDDALSRPEAIRRLVEQALDAESSPQPSSKQTARKASTLAAREIENLGDTSQPLEEQQRRKRTLIRGPKEFREIRADQPKPKRWATFVVGASLPGGLTHWEGHNRLRREKKGARLTVAVISVVTISCVGVARSSSLEELQLSCAQKPIVVGRDGARIGEKLNGYCIGFLEGAFALMEQANCSNGTGQPNLPWKPK
jgi:hypothetical protein